MLKKRELGNSGIFISVLGLGTVKFGRNSGVKYPSTFEIPPLEDLKNLLALAQDLGINCLDTAPAYGLSEERLGQLLRNGRQDWVIVSKAGEYFQNGESSFDFTPKALEKSLHETLKKLNTDYVDVFLIHSDGNDAQNIQDFEVFDTLNRLKQQGKIRLGGMSTKTVEGGLLTVQHSDVVMVMHHPCYQEEIQVIETAFKANKGVIIKKALASGHLNQLGNNSDPVTHALDFVLNTPGVTSTMIGTINPVHLKENVLKAQKIL